MWLFQIILSFNVIIFGIGQIVIRAQANELAKGEIKFSINLYSQEANLSGRSFLLAPFSIFTLLVLLGQGAEGRTYSEIAKALHLNSNKAMIATQYHKCYKKMRRNAGSTIFNVTNRIYVQNGCELNETFQAAAEFKFKCDIQSMDLADAEDSANTINDFIELRTDDKVQTLVTPELLSADTCVVIVNTIYLKGLWEHKFDKKHTKSGTFSTTERATYMNTVNDFNYAELSELKASALEMRYANSSLSFVVILPNFDVKLADVERRLETHDWDNIPSRMQMRKVNVTIPKIKMEISRNLNYVLSRVGIRQIFDDEADLSGILGTPEPMKVADIVQKCIIELDEDGAEAAAAAATAVIITTQAMSVNPPELINFDVNRPFLYYILETVEKTILFTGRFASTRV